MDERSRGSRRRTRERGETLDEGRPHRLPAALATRLAALDGRRRPGRPHLREGVAARGQRDDGVVLCGRLREGWTLHIVLDTSGSMVSMLPKVLGAIASFCEGAGVSEVHILQCDVEVTRDEWLEPAQLAEYNVAGFGGSDMSPAWTRWPRIPRSAPRWC